MHDSVISTALPLTVVASQATAATLLESASPGNVFRTACACCVMGGRPRGTAGCVHALPPTCPWLALSLDLWAVVSDGSLPHCMAGALGQAGCVCTRRVCDERGVVGYPQESSSRRNPKLA